MNELRRQLKWVEGCSQSMNHSPRPRSSTKQTLQSLTPPPKNNIKKLNPTKPNNLNLQNFTSRANCKCPHSQKHQQKPALIKSHTCAYQLQDLTGYNRALMPPLDNTDFSNAWRQVNNNTTSQSCAYHQQRQQQQQQDAKDSKRHYHHHTCPRQRKKSMTPVEPTHLCQKHQEAKQRRSRSASAKPRRNSSYHSYDDLDVSSAVLNAERKVVASLKYLCACTGATLRNLSKKTKDLHAKNYTYTKVNGA